MAASIVLHKFLVLDLKNINTYSFVSNSSPEPQADENAEAAEVEALSQAARTQEAFEKINKKIQVGVHSHNKQSAP
jgi:hypothetical protein